MNLENAKIKRLGLLRVLGVGGVAAAMLLTGCRREEPVSPAALKGTIPPEIKAKQDEALKDTIAQERARTQTEGTGQ
ncbi:MAG: hypothetical protein H7Z41_02235 [Cytophagales bacterium]|nr:hypothetical protein [Armatimonadota bacterium]